MTLVKPEPAKLGLRRSSRRWEVLYITSTETGGGFWCGFFPPVLSGTSELWRGGAEEHLIDTAGNVQLPAGHSTLGASLSFTWDTQEYGGFILKTKPSSLGGPIPFTPAIPAFPWSSHIQAQHSPAPHFALLHCFVCAFKSAASAPGLGALPAFRNLS